MGETLDKFLAGLAVELARVENRQTDLLEECRAATTTELLTDFEREFGVPDSCAPELEETIALRRKVVVTKETYRGRANEDHFVDLAKELGYTDVDSVQIAVQEFRPSWVGILRVGEVIAPQEIIFHWWLLIPFKRVAFTEPNRSPFSVGFDLGFEKSYWNNGANGGNIIRDTLRCFIERYAPAHTIPEVVYTGESFSSGFSNGFRAMPSVHTYTDGGFAVGFGGGFDKVYWERPSEFVGGFDNGFSAEDFDVMSDPKGFDGGFSSGFYSYYCEVVDQP